MRTRLAVFACALFGCAGTDLDTDEPAQAADGVVVAAPVVPTSAAKPRSGGWPSASDGAGERERTRADFDRLALQRDRMESLVSRGGCVSPNPIRTGDEQTDLRLEIRGPKRMAKSDFPELSGTIRNVSRKRAHAIVLPGDGSDAGWRDPVISFTAFIDEGDGCWKPLASASNGRCGLFDHDWSDEIVEVRAGGSKSIDPMWAHPFFEWKRGTVRLFVHYAWTGGTAAKGGGGPPAFDIGAMAKERPYELISNAIELEVTG